MEKIVVGTRASQLAVKQTKIFCNNLNKIFPKLTIDIKKITTSGDRIKDKQLYQFGGKGLFIKEIEAALLNQEIDLAVHSLKDMPGQIPDVFSLGCFPHRADARDVLISSSDKTLDELPQGAVLGTGSLRRQLQLKKYRPDLNFVNLRGNVDTRIEKMKKQNLDGIILAACGLHRLNLNSLITEYIAPTISLPAVGQGTLGIEILTENIKVKKMIKPLEHQPTSLCSLAERKFLSTLNGSCHLPLGCYARINLRENKFVFKITGFLASRDGTKHLKKDKKHILGTKNKKLEKTVLKLGKNLALEILNDGGQKILAEMKE